jgi:hydroxymethylbilane synthase
MAAVVRIGTRGSGLALAQTGWVAEQLRGLGHEVIVETMSTRGDDRRDLPLTTLGGDGVFVRELERALLEGRIDLAVHSLKDLPTASSPGLEIGCVPSRACPFDAFVGRGGFPVQHIGALEMPAQRSHDIDTLADFELCERLLAEPGRQPKT